MSKSLTFAQRIILNDMRERASLDSEGVFTYPLTRGEALGMDRRTLMRGMKRLRADGLVELVQRGVGRSRFSRYRLAEPSPVEKVA